MEIFDAVRNGLNLKHETCSEHLNIRIQDSNGGFLLNMVCGKFMSSHKRWTFFKNF